MATGPYESDQYPFCYAMEDPGPRAGVSGEEPREGPLGFGGGWGVCPEGLGPSLYNPHSWPNSHASGSFLPVLGLLHLEPASRFRACLSGAHPLPPRCLAQCLPHTRGSRTSCQVGLTSSCQYCFLPVVCRQSLPHSDRQLSRASRAVPKAFPHPTQAERGMPTALSHFCSQSQVFFPAEGTYTGRERPSGLGLPSPRRSKAFFPGAPPPGSSP